MYECNYCNYRTNITCNYIKHINTIKHLNNIKTTINKELKDLKYDEHSKAPRSTLKHSKALRSTQGPKFVSISNNISNNSDIGNCNELKCEYCKQIFKNKRTIHKHQLKSCIKISDNIRNRMIIKHNDNAKTKHKLQLVNTNISNSKIYNINNNISGNTITSNNTSTANNISTSNNISNNIDNINSINSNDITNNNFTLNTFSNQSLDHIPDEKMNEIAKGDTSMMYLLCREMAKLPENNNTFINTRKDLAYYFDDDKTIKIDRLKQYIYKFCNKYMERMKQHILDNPNKFTQISKNVFKDTYDIYFCVINKNNFENMDKIEAEHEAMIKQFVDDVKINLINSNKVSRKYLDSIEKDFYKLS
jgi:hypothetical protein